MTRPAIVLALTALAAVAPAGAQDVEMLGRRYGTPVPRAYWDALASDAGAFRFSRGRAARLRSELAGRGGGGGDDAEEDFRVRSAAALGPRATPVRGDFRVPVILGLFSDTPTQPAFGSDEVDVRLFGDGELSVSAYYDEVSSGRFHLDGDVFPWTRAGSRYTRTWVTNGSSGLTSRTARFIRSLVASMPADIDWGAYDNDGPDGLPNSGDDDGYVDALAVYHPDFGAECSEDGRDDRIWSHKWSLSVGGGPWSSSTPAAADSVDFVRIDDYFIQGVVSCDRTSLNEIGVFAHEAGHALGLPDLYDTNPEDGRHQGAGTWDLMAAGGWGCDDRTPERPCHLGAWSKMVLGWVDVVDVPPGSDLGRVILPGVQSGSTVYRVRAADDSGDYFLLENRTRRGFDLRLPAPGMLVWHIDPEWVDQWWPANMVNAFQRRGVWLRQADGRDDLGTSGSGRGDAGDPFPQAGTDAGGREFHGGSWPASRAAGGSATGVTLLDIEREGEDVGVRILNRMSRVIVVGEGTRGVEGLFSVDGGVGRPRLDVPTAPFTERVVEAAPGEVLEEGMRRPFRAWADGSADRQRTVSVGLGDVQLVARYAGLEYEIALDVTGGVDGVEPGTFASEPAGDGLWFEPGVEALVTAVPVTGFAFRSWTGPLAGQPNPARVVVDGPVRAGAAFDLVYAPVSARASIHAASQEVVVLEAEHANQPVTWSLVDGTLPDGLALSTGGRILGSAMETGRFDLRVEATDALGLRGEADITLEVTEPEIPVERLAQPFVLAGEALTGNEQRFLDRRGNADGGYDLGDLRAWVLAHPDLPMEAALQTLLGVPDTVRVRVTPRREEPR